jgi:peptidoglycan/LPS O-acetylase OafA/YrhL
MIVGKWLGMQGFNFIEGSILWSVTCEFFYYACYPIFRQAAKIIGWPGLAALSFVVSYAIALHLGSDAGGNIHIYGWYLNWLVMLPAWLIGATLANYFCSIPPIKWVWVWRGVIALSAAALYWATTETPAGFYLTLNPFAFLVAIWILAEINAAYGNRIALLEWAGKWSFSLYLVHTIVSYGSSVYLHKTSVFFQVPFALVVSFGFYLAIERPSHRLARQIFRRLQPSGQIAQTAQVEA